MRCSALHTDVIRLRPMVVRATATCQRWATLELYRWSELGWCVVQGIGRRAQQIPWIWLLSGIVLGVLLARTWEMLPPRNADAEALSVFREAYTLTRERYVGEEQTEPKKLVYDAIRGMVQGLGDTAHSRFLTPEQRAREARNLAGMFVGIGVEMTERDGRPVVMSVYPGSPAAAAGIGAQDRFLRVNGEDVSTMPLSELGQRLSGPEGSQVRLTVLHPDDTTMDVTVRREQVRIPAVTWAPLNGTSLWQIHISRFSRGAAEELDRALAQIRDAGATGIVLDLRDNPGGLLDEAVGVVSRFVDDGVVLVERDRQGNDREVRTTDHTPITDLPIVVLINRGSASSSEVVTAALLYHDRATAVGDTTFGTGTVLRTYGLSDGSALVLGVQEWLTPEGRPIRNQGITPNEVVSLPAGVEPTIPAEPSAPVEQPCASADTQLRAAATELGLTCPAGAAASETPTDRAA
jgi:carboxyl-terminal processing protease